MPNSVQQGTDFSDRQHSTAGQLVSTLGSGVLNELRVQYATRTQSRAPGSQAGTGPGIRINGVANFGGPVQGNADSGFGFTEGIFQVLDNVTYIRGNHAYKFGFNAQAVSDSAHADADPALHVRERRRVSGGAQRSESVRLHLVPAIRRQSHAWVRHADGWGFVQDDWRLTPALKLLYGSALRHLHAAGGRRDRCARRLARSFPATRTTCSRGSGSSGLSARIAEPCYAATAA